MNDLSRPKRLLPEAAMLSNKVSHVMRVGVTGRRRRKDGTLFDVSILGAPIFHGGKQMASSLSIAISASPRRQKRTDDPVKLFLKSSLIVHRRPLSSTTNNDVVVDVNEEFTHMFGYKPCRGCRKTHQRPRSVKRRTKKRRGVFPIRSSTVTC